MDKCVVCGTTAGYKVTEDETDTYFCLLHFVDGITEAADTSTYVFSRLPHTRLIGDFYNTGGYIGS